MDRVAVLDTISPLMDFSIKNIEHNPRTRVLVQPDAVILRPGDGKRALTLAPDGVKSMATYAGFPVDLAKQLSPDTFARVATELLDRKEIYSVTMKDQLVVAFGKPGIERNLSPQRVLATIEKSIKVEDYNRCMLTPDNGVILDITGERRLQVKKGDVVQAGANVVFSPIGSINPMVQSYVLRLACTNGATTEEVIREYRYRRGGGGGEGDDIWHFFRESIREAYHSVERIVANWRNLDEKHIDPEHRAAIIEAVLTKAHITGELADAVRAEAMNHPPQSEYDVMNLITWASSHLLTSPRQVMKARETAAQWAAESQHARVCPICHTRRN